MHGILHSIGTDDKGNPRYAVKTFGVIFSVDQREVGIRNIIPGSLVEFGTDRETGDARLWQPAPVRGCEMEPTSS